MNSDISKITGYFNLALVALFILLVIGVVIAALRGLRRGVWKSTHNMIFMLSLIIIAFVTLDPLCKFIENLNISKFYTGTLILSRTVNGEQLVYAVPLTTVKETASEFLQGIYLLFNVSSSASSATNFAFAIVESFLKIILFIVEMILIVTLGNLLSFITWFAIFQHFIPKIARKNIKIRWLGAIETAVTYLVLTVLFFTPFTSIVNSINQSYQKNKPDTQNTTVLNIGNFVDAYNDSLFAKILFNWTVDKDGMTIDTKLFSTFTTGISEDVAVNIVDELTNLSKILVIAAQGVAEDEQGKAYFDGIKLVTKDTVDSMFDILGKSGLITNIFPVVAEIALHSDMLNNVFPSKLLNVSDVEWKNEIKNVQEMVDCLFDSGAIDSLFITGEDGKRQFRNFQGNGAYEFFESLVFDENFDEILNVFKGIDDSKVLSRLVPALIYMFENSAQGAEMKQYLPFSWEELNEFSWGFELYVLLDFLHKTVTIDRDFLKAFMIQTNAYTPAADEEYKKLAEVISEHIDDFNDLIVGSFDASGNLENSDKYGRTIVFNKGQRISGRNYCLFDMKIFELALPDVLERLYDLDFMANYSSQITEADTISYKKAVDNLKKGVVLANFKKEFRSILDVVGVLGKDTELLDAVLSKNFGSLLEDPDNVLSLKTEHVLTFKDAIYEMGNSSLLYSGVTPIFRSIFAPGGQISSSLSDFGIDTEVIIAAIDQDSRREHHTLFEDLGSLLGHWDDFKSVFEIVDAGDDLMTAMKDSALVDKLTSLLSALVENNIINPSPEAGDHFEKNENLYNILEFVFGQFNADGLVVTRETLRNVETPTHRWSDEINALGEIIKYVAVHDVTNASNLFSDGVTRSAISKLKDDGEGNVGLPALFALIDNSYIFSSSLGPFLDNMFDSSLSGFLVDKGNNVSFSNIASWTQEGQNIGKLLDSLYNLVPANDEEAKNFLADFDMSKLHNVVELNDMLHQLSHSGIFTYIDEQGISHYQFGTWFYQKTNDAMVKFTVNSNQYDLLADPKPAEDSTWQWKESWGIRPGEGIENADPYFSDYQQAYNADGTATETHMLSYRDFVYFEGIEDTDPTLPSLWCNYEAFTVKQAAFLAANSAKLTDPNGAYLTEEGNYWGDYFASDTFITDYTEVFECDEISRVCRFMTYSMRVIENTKTGPHPGQQIPFNELPIPLVEGLLTAINQTTCLRVCLYNFYRIAADNLLNGYSAFNLSSAYLPYIIDTNLAVNDFTNARPLRQLELDKLVDFYRTIDKAKKNGIISGSDFVYSKLNQDGFINDMKQAVNDLNTSYVFHRLGSSKVGALTTFQGLLNSMLSQSSVQDVIYLGEKSPKDASATLYSDKTTKINYLVTSTFLTDEQINAQSLSFEEERNKQTTEINNMLDTVDALYSLKNSSGTQATSLSEADMNNHDNIEVINTLFNKLNNSNLLYDALPNSIYNIFIENNQLSIQSGEDQVDFKRVDPFYHYYFVDTVQRSTPSYTAKYLAKDISGIVALLEDYQEFNNQLNGKQVSDPAALKLVTGEGGALKGVLYDMHDSNLFHSPARNYSGVSYYTNKYETGTGYTLFEEMMSKICSFVKLDTFAYDDTYANDVSTYGSAANKLQNRIENITSADDTGVSNAAYHNQQGLAWKQEVDAMMTLANTAADLGSGTTLDVSSFELDKLAPVDVKRMLTALNASDLVGDAVPKFVKDGFVAIKLGTLTSYNSVDYATYRIGQVNYGGTQADASEGSEIDNIYQVMNSLYTGSSYLDGMDNLTNFVKTSEGQNGLRGLMRYLYNSHILNTNKDMNNGYNHYYTVDGKDISARGALIVNALGDDLATYIARDADNLTPIATKLDQISRISKILSINQYANETVKTYQVEAEGLITLVNSSDGKINATSLSADKIQTADFRENTKPAILSIISASYNATNESDEANYKRSLIASEFISGVLNNVLENEYTKLDNATNYPGYQYLKFSFGNDVNDGDVTFSDYLSVNKVERDGLDGMIDSLQQVNSLATLNSSSIAALKANFAKMGQVEGQNSKLAQAIYLAEAHSKFKILALTPNVRMEYFVPVDETTTNANVANNIYSNTFSFKEYGERVEAFLS